MTRALLVLHSDKQRQQALKWVAGVPPMTRIEFKSPRRSLEQNNLMWARLTEISQAVLWHGQKLSPEDWKDVFSAGLKRARVVPGIEPGTVVALGLRTSDLSVPEMTDLLEYIAHFAAERGVELTA